MKTGCHRSGGMAFDAATKLTLRGGTGVAMIQIKLAQHQGNRGLAD
jgi:hypothetical protein